jgi:hypothetical protein
VGLLSAPRSRKSGYAPIEMTILLDVEISITYPFSLSKYSKREHPSTALRTGRKTFPRRSINTEISPLRCASVEMTKGRVTLPREAVAGPRFSSPCGIKPMTSSVEITNLLRRLVSALGRS